MNRANTRRYWQNNDHQSAADVCTLPSQNLGTASRLGPGQIPQHELAEFLRLKRELNEARKRYDMKREELLAARQSGAEVEHGALVLKLDEVVNRQITAKSLLPLLGAAKVSALKAQVEPTMFYRLTVSQAR